MSDPRAVRSDLGLDEARGALTIFTNSGVPDEIAKWTHGRAEVSVAPYGEEVEAPAQHHDVVVVVRAAEVGTSAPLLAELVATRSRGAGVWVAVESRLEPFERGTERALSTVRVATAELLGDLLLLSVEPASGDGDLYAALGQLTGVAQLLSQHGVTDAGARAADSPADDAVPSAASKSSGEQQPRAEVGRVVSQDLESSVSKKEGRDTGKGRPRQRRLFRHPLVVAVAVLAAALGAVGAVVADDPMSALIGVACLAMISFVGVIALFTRRLILAQRQALQRIELALRANSKVTKTAATEIKSSLKILRNDTAENRALNAIVVASLDERTRASDDAE